MTCHEFVEFLNDYLSGDLPQASRIEFDGHLAECSNCTAYMKSYRETVRLAKTVCAEPDGPVPGEVPEELVQAILAAFAKSP